VPLDQLIRDTPGAHPIISIATLNLKDLRTSPGTAGCGCPGRSLGRLAHRGGGQRMRGVRSRRGQQARLSGCSGAGTPVAGALNPVVAVALAGQFPPHYRELHHEMGG
jgi:hypothetical protein